MSNNEAGGRKRYRVYSNRKGSSRSSLGLLSSPRAVAWGMGGLTILYLLGCGASWTIAKSVYVGTPINGDRANVRYALGGPDAFSNDGQGWITKGDPETARLWHYSSPNLVVTYSPESDRAISIACVQNATLSGAVCPGALGVGVDQDEQDVFEVLGTPSSETLANGRKTLHYDEVGYDFVLERRKVIGIRARQANGGLFDSLSRFFIWMIP